MKKILLIATGGTIASKDSKTGLKPQLDGNELLNYLDDIGDFCSISTITLFNLDSTNINYHHWIMIARCIVLLSPTELILWRIHLLPYLI